MEDQNNRLPHLPPSAAAAIVFQGTACVGFVGGTNGALQSTLKDVYKPVTSQIPAFTCVQADAAVKEYDGVKYLGMAANKIYEYRVNNHEGGGYDLLIDYRSDEDCEFEIYQNGVKFAEATLSATSSATLRSVLRGLQLSGDAGVITFLVKKGSADLLEFSFHRAEEVQEITYDFSGSVKSVHKEGRWAVRDGVLTTTKAGYGKYMLGSANWGDYAVEAEITPTADVIDLGLCVRVSNPSAFQDAAYGERAPERGVNYLQGYYIAFEGDAVVLVKQNYDRQQLKRVPYDLQKDVTYLVKAELSGNNLTVSINGTTLIEYQDTEAPFLHGMVGFKANNCTMTVDNLKISPIK